MSKFENLERIALRSDQTLRILAYDNHPEFYREFTEQTATAEIRKKIMDDMKSSDGKSITPLSIVGVLAAVLVFLGVLRLALFPLDPPQPTPTASPSISPIETTPTPTYTVTPTVVPLTPTNTATEAPIPTTTSIPHQVYDDFEQSSFDGSFDTNRWIPPFDQANTISQTNGMLRINPPLGEEVRLAASQYHRFKISEPMFFEVKMSSEATQSEGVVYTGLDVHFDEQSEWYTHCNHAGLGALFSCRVATYDGQEEKTLYETKAILPNSNQVTVRIEVYPSEMSFVYYIDEEQAGSYLADNVEVLWDSEFSFGIATHDGQGKNITGAFDQVNIGVITNQHLSITSDRTDTAISTPIPTATPVPNAVYDDFNQSDFDGSFDTNRWIPPFDQANTISQTNGMLRINPPVGEAVQLVASRYHFFEITKPMFFEVTILLVSEQLEGVIYTGLEVHFDEQNEWSTSCSNERLRTAFGCQVKSYDGQKEEFLYATESVDLNRGQIIVRIEVDPSEMLFVYYINDTQIGSYLTNNAEALRDSDFSFGVGTYDDHGKNITSSFDQVNIGVIMD